jgi:gluconolactonase
VTAVTPGVAARPHVPGPPELLPGRPDAVIDPQSADGCALVGGLWRYADARVEHARFVELAGPGTPDPLGPGDVPNRTYDVVPHVEGADFDDSDWRMLAPEETMHRLATGRVCFNWYRIVVEIPQRVGDLDPTGATVVFAVVVDDYAEVWVDGHMPLSLGDTGGHVVAGFNAPNRVVLTRDARPGQRSDRGVRHQRADGADDGP